MIPFLRSLILLGLLTGTAAASEEAFTQTAFDRLQQQGAPILVWIHADWCPTCRAQEPVLKELLEQEEFKPIRALRVDFDRQKEIVKAFKVLKQSTLIVFKGGKEVDRNLGVTREQDIADFLRKAL
ncbi:MULTISPECIES: thioredoxin family protein [Methylomicrobium]|uniref:Thioredoxin domain-containing protein n=1 Tax=Methylomicrobium album BG8 TaxID=686340 RepID=H8GQ98_METAL|nr:MULTISPECIES: thioredoxin family protein [Methylomicrobium]EIC28557.1 thioredoxin domain-containing protein [Methylomicrobium album BG8]